MTHYLEGILFRCHVLFNKDYLFILLTARRTEQVIRTSCHYTDFIGQEKVTLFNVHNQLKIRGDHNLTFFFRSARSTLSPKTALTDSIHLPLNHFVFVFRRKQLYSGADALTLLTTPRIVKVNNEQ